MPLYDYYCSANGQTVEVRHGMLESVETWGDVCELAGLEQGVTAAEAPVERKVSAGVPLTGRSTSSGADSGPAPCGPSCGCAWDA
jgi:hypothetical protein